MTGNLITINGTAIPNLTKYVVAYNKLWKDAERNMNGDIRASLIGIFPKIELEIGGLLTASIVQTLCGLLDQAYFSVTFTDPKTNSTYTGQYYASDYSIELLDKNRMIYKPFSVNLVPVSKRA